MTKYRLMRDCPNGLKGSIWEKKEHNQDSYWMESEQDKTRSFSTPKDAFPQWFEEIKEMPKFTKEQVRKIKDVLNPHFVEYSSFAQWLNENTEE